MRDTLAAVVIAALVLALVVLEVLLPILAKRRSRAKHDRR